MYRQSISKKCCSYTAAATLLLAGCLGLPTKPPPAARVVIPIELTADSGFLTRAQVLPFLVNNELADSLNSWWKQWKPADTMGKYYRMQDNNYLVCVLASDDKGNVEENRLVVVNSKGLYVESQDFFSDYCSLNRRTQALQKRGKYFLTYTCGSGSNYGSSWFSLFTKLSERKESGQLLEWQHMGAPDCYDIASHWKVSGDSCTIAYTVQKGTSTFNGCEDTRSEYITVIYTFKNGGWTAADSSKLKKMRIER